MRHLSHKRPLQNTPLSSEPEASRLNTFRNRNRLGGTSDTGIGRGRRRLETTEEESENGHGRGRGSGWRWRKSGQANGRQGVEFEVELENVTKIVPQNNVTIDINTETAQFNSSIIIV